MIIQLVIIGGLVLTATLIFASKSKIAIFIKGKYDKFFKNMSRTPEGAEIVIDRNIKNLEEDYTIKKSMLVELIGNEKEQNEMIKDLEKREKDLMNKGKQASLENNNGIAKSYAINLKNVRESLEKCRQNVVSITENKKDLELVVEVAQQKLLALKDEKLTIIKQMQIDEKIIKTYEKMDSLISQDNSEEMLNDVRETAKQLRYKKQGLKEVYENDIMTKMTKYDNDIDVADIMDEFKKND